MACENCNCGKKQIEEAMTEKLETVQRIDLVQIKQRHADKLLSGRNVMVVMNGQPIRHCKSVEVKVNSKGLGIVKIEMYASVEMDEAVVADADVSVHEEEKRG